MQKDGGKVRSVKHSNFLHGKMYLAESADKTPSAIIGRSNFTQRGLGANLEINIALSGCPLLAELSAWFDELWSTTILPTTSNEKLSTPSTASAKTTTPSSFYLKTLYEISRNALKEQDESERRIRETRLQNSAVWNKLYEFQKHGTQSVIDSLQQHNGCIFVHRFGNVVQFMERVHPRRFQGILKRIADKIPGIDQIDTEKTSDGRLLLRFNDKGFQAPFYAQQVSDGTLKVFAYLLLLEDPTPPAFLCIEEPENGLYHKLLETLADEFREHANRRGGSQIFMTTHQPYLVDALEPKEVWILEKDTDGFSTVQRASEDPIVNNMVEEGLPLGGLWYSDYLDPR